MFIFTRTLFLLLFASIAFNADAQVTANFTADVSSGCAPLIVNFTNTSAGAISYHWNLANGTTTNQQNASGSFLTPGTYTVTLTAYNGTDSSIKTLVITAYPPPNVNFNADTAACPGATISFINTTNPESTGPTTYAWNFGDGGTSTAQNATHAFPVSGHYNITLIATNSNGCVSSLTKSNYIHILTPATPAFAATNFYFCKAPAQAAFTNQSAGVQTLTYEWEYGDGATGSSPTHTYTATGIYTVTLIVTDGNECVDSLVKPSYIYVQPFVGTFTAPTSACAHQPVVFYDNQPWYVTANWNFGDGGTSTLDTPAHVFNTPGTYNVQLIMYNGHCYDTVIKPITINPGPAASFTSLPQHPCPAPFTLQFSSSAPAGTTYEWVFGDGGTSPSANPSHTFQNNGVDTIKLIVTNGVGCVDTVVQIDTFYNFFIGLLGNVNGGCIPFTVQFSTYHLTNDPDTLVSHPYPFPVTYLWNFGDGSAPVTDSAPAHTFTTVGTFTVTLTVTTANGCSQTVSAQIHAGTPPIPSFTYTPAHICADRTVTFTNTSTNATNYVWRFGDGDGSAENNPIHQYILPGVFTVTLIAYNNGCADSIIMTDIITVDSPKALIAMNFGCSPRTQVNFYDSSMGATSLLWMFSDGDTSTQLNPVHNFPLNGIDTARLATYNSASGCRDTAVQAFSLIAPQLSFIANDTAICKWGNVHFTPVITGGSAEYYYWYINGVYISDQDPFIDTFNITGNYSVTLIIKDDFGCYDTLTKNNYILVAKPIDSFSVSPATGCWPLTVQFSDYSSDVSGAVPASWQWFFGDGTTASVNTPNTSHIYTNVGASDVTEIVTDNIGCKDTLSKPSLIHVTKPTAAFYANTLTPCLGSPVQFTNYTMGGVQSSYWIFGDGTTSTQTSPLHLYTQTGVYTVSLVVTDNNGCIDTATYPNYINVNSPIASFTLSDTFTVCPPLLEQFTNTSTGAVSYLWIFGNNNTSTGVNPSNDYTASGSYTILLIAKDIHGCPDTAIGHVSIYGYAGAFSYEPLTGCAPLTVSFSAAISQVPDVIWDFSDGNVLNATNGDTITHTYSIPGAYVPKLILSNNAGCQNSSTGIDTIKVDGVKVGYTTTPVCMHDTVTFQDTSTGYFSSVVAWQWTFNSLDTSSLKNPSYYYDTTGSFPVTLIVTNASGCKDTLSDSIVAHPLPVITTSGDTTVCVGDAAHLSGSGGISYSWTPVATTSCATCQTTNASPTVVTVYTVTGTDANGCSNVDSVKVNVKTTTVAVAGANNAICYGDSVIISDSGAQTYTWYPATDLSNAHSGNPLAYPTSTTTYMVVAQDGTCIPDTSYVTIVVHPLPTVNAGGDQTIIAGNSTRLQATSNAFRYLWAPAATLNCDTCSNPTATPTGTTTYVVTAFSQYDCEDSAKTTVHVLCDNSQVFIPNSFTPNGDGQNDIFYPRGTGVSKISSFRIYNRWGEVLFERTNIGINDAGNGWDGSYKGGLPQADVYVYVVDAICNSGEPMTIKGDVTIIR